MYCVEMYTECNGDIKDKSTAWGVREGLKDQVIIWADLSEVLCWLVERRTEKGIPADEMGHAKTEAWTPSVEGGAKRVGLTWGVVKTRQRRKGKLMGTV